MKLKLFLFFTCCLLFACNNGSEIHFPLEKSVVFKEMNIGDNFGKIMYFKAKGDYIFACEQNEDTQLQLFNKQTKTSYNFGLIGEGPGRVLGCISILPHNDDIYVCDISKSNIIKYNIDSVVSNGKSCIPEIVVDKLDNFPFDIGYLKDTSFVMLALRLGLDRLAIIDKDGNEIFRGGTLPPKENDKILDLVHAYAYIGRLTTNIKDSRIAICTQYGGILQIYQYENSNVDLVKEQLSFIPAYVQNGENFGVTNQTRWGYISIDSNDKYIFMLYSGFIQRENPLYYLGNEIHVFDWDGNPVQKLKTNRNLSHICVDGDTLYGYDNDIEDIVVVSL
jgi:hypothetical protein